MTKGSIRLFRSDLGEHFGRGAPTYTSCAMFRTHRSHCWYIDSTFEHTPAVGQRHAERATALDMIEDNALFRMKNGGFDDTLLVRVAEVTV
jgi:hypothetical protein